MVGNGSVSDPTRGARPRRGEVLALAASVHKYVDAADWCRLLAQPVPLARICEALIALARMNGSKDDATVLLLQRTLARQPGAGGHRRSAGPAGSARRER